MQASVAMDAPLGFWSYDDDLDDAPTREWVIHRAHLSERADEPDIVAIELGGREAALAALSELAEADELRDEETPTRELTVGRFRACDFDLEQIEALAAIELGDDDIVLDYREPAWRQDASVDLATAIARVLDSAAAMREVTSPWAAPPKQDTRPASAAAKHWTLAALAVLLVEMLVLAAIV